MISSKQVHLVWEAYLHSEKVCNNLRSISASINVVAQEQEFLTCTTKLLSTQHFTQVIELSMNIAEDHNLTVDSQNIRLSRHKLLCHICHDQENLFRELATSKLIVSYELVIWGLGPQSARIDRVDSVQTEPLVRRAHHFIDLSVIQGIWKEFVLVWLGFSCIATSNSFSSARLYHI